MRKSHRTITNTSKESQKCQAANSNLPFKIIAKLERTQAHALQNMDKKHRTPQSEQQFVTNQQQQSLQNR